MEAKSIEVCKLCMKSMTDPRILPCSDSFCLKCLESSDISNDSPKCPTCLIEFQMPQGGLKDLKKNEFIEQLSSIKQNHVTCDSCKINQAVNFCVECSFNYCSTCLEHHGRIPITRSHQLEPPISKDEVEVNLCKKHSAMKTLFCESCKVLSCIHCFSVEHGGHTMKTISEYFDSVKIILEQNLKVKEEMIERIHAAVNIISEKRNDNELKASNLKKEIQQRGENLKNLIDSIVVESKKVVDEEFERQFKESGNLMNELTSLEKNIKEEIEALQKQLNTMTHENVPEVFPRAMDKDENIPQYSENFDVTFKFHVSEELVKLEKIFGDVVKVQKVSVVKEVKLSQRVELFAFGKSGVYVCMKDGYTFEIKKVFPCPEWRDDVSSCKLEKLSDVHDLLIYDDRMFASGRNDYKTNGIVSVSLSNDIDMFYKTEKNGCWKMSKFSDDEFLVISKNKVLHLSLTSPCYDRVKKEINLPFNVDAVLHLNNYHFAVISSGKVFIINEQHEQLFKFEPYDDICLDSTSSLAKDNHGNIYAYSSSGKVLILDLNLRLKAVCTIEKDLTKFCFDEDRDCFMAFGPPSTLLTYKF